MMNTSQLMSAFNSFAGHFEEGRFDRFYSIRFEQNRGVYLQGTLSDSISISYRLSPNTDIEGVTDVVKEWPDSRTFPLISFKYEGVFFEIIFT